jgi:hypothetical protein
MADLGIRAGLAKPALRESFPALQESLASPSEAFLDMACPASFQAPYLAVAAIAPRPFAWQRPTREMAFASANWPKRVVDARGGIGLPTTNERKAIATMKAASP